MLHVLNTIMSTTGKTITLCKIICKTSCKTTWL